MMIDSGRCMPFHLFFLEVVSTFEVMDICCGGLASNLFRPLQKKKNGRQTTSLRFLKKNKILSSSSSLGFLLLCSCLVYSHDWNIQMRDRSVHSCQTFPSFLPTFFFRLLNVPVCVCVGGGAAAARSNIRIFIDQSSDIIVFIYARAHTHTHNGG